ncbi:hypothetical protein [Leptospira idonii]|uniref:Uncharacterized protein n=1 Tax=Leptospira idonii TaxID=1193500 RepID=A0A4R9M266_9LEPT|nr:hypothetical protein [Leptospira idonii]TGN19389.1 hypothetical protein EHS15_08580 [Leptospira idonii]
MKKLGMLLVAIAIVTHCKPDKDDKTAENLLILSYLSSNSQAAAASQSSQVRATVGAIASSINTAARGNQVTFFFPKGTWTKERLMAFLNRKTLNYLISSELTPNIKPTALSASGGTCNSSGCNATLNGTTNCSSGGTVTLTNMKVTFTFPKALSYESTLDGTATTDKCASYGADYYNYPKYVSAVSSGKLTIKGKTNVSVNDYTFAAGSNNTIINTDFNYDENITVNSDALDIGNSTTIALKDVISIVSLRTVGQQKDFSTSNVNNVITVKVSVTEALTGTVSISGLVGGVAVNLSKTYAGDTFSYRYTCVINIANQIGTCEIVQ